MRNIRIFQFTPALKHGDGVGNDVFAIHDFLTKEKKIDSKIIYEFGAEEFDPQMAKNIRNVPYPNEDDILLIHLSTAWNYNEFVCNLPGRKVFVYHNITPSKFFEEYSTFAYDLCENGIEQIKELKKYPEYCLADSRFNKEDLISYGYTCPIDVLPIIIPFEDYQKPADEETIKELKDGLTNILFVGRIAPNKKQEDIILSFYHYQKNYNPNSRLILLGAYDEGDGYYQRLTEFVKELGVKNVNFTSHISFDKVLAIYRSADLFLCLSEHEGFCIPIIEAMMFETPIIAYDSTAVKDTLGDGGILLKDKNPLEVAGMMDYLLNHKELTDELKNKQKLKLEEMKYERITAKLWEYLTKFEPRLIQE